MDEVITTKKPKSFFKERILRFRPIVFLKKNILPISILLILLLSFLLGFWNVKKYEMYNYNGNEIETKVYTIIETYIKENIIGKNFFKIYSNTTENEILKSISYVKSVKIEKSIPNKIILFIDIYKPKSVAYVKSNKCYLLSSEGIVLEELCTEGDTTCCTEYSSTNNLYFFSSKDVDIAEIQDEKKKLLIMDDIEKIVTIIETFGYSIKNITLEDNLVEITDTENHISKFSTSYDIDTQLQRYYAVMGKIKSDSISFISLDVRFERPVMKN